MMEDLYYSPIWHPYTPVPQPLPAHVICQTQGSYLIDSGGNRYFDAISSWWCILHGHCHPRLVETLHRQARKLDQICLASQTHEVAFELASKLLEVVGPPYQKVFYSDNGSTAVETALKMALQFWSQGGRPLKKKFMALEGGYHGETLGALSVGAISQFHQPFTNLLTPLRISLEWPIENLQSFFEQNAAETAALVLEPGLLGGAGMKFFPLEKVDCLMEFCDRHSILVIFDEVLTGFGRLGPLFAKELCQKTPDFICLSKGLTSGMLALGATVVTGRIFEAFCGPKERTFFHGHTFCGNGLACAVALESLKIFDEEKVLEKNRSLSLTLSKGIEKLSENPKVYDPRGRGMVVAFDLEKAETAARIASEIWNEGISLRPLGSTLYLIPPYSATEEELEGVFETLGRMIGKV